MACASAGVPESSALQDGNVLGGSFRLSFLQQTTASISYNAAASEMQVALEDLPAIGGVAVKR
jgi:hypothetical protein